jgi:septal ring factor EnvC (AmiA/AmiB activator)
MWTRRILLLGLMLGAVAVGASYGQSHDSEQPSNLGAELAEVEREVAVGQGSLDELQRQKDRLAAEIQHLRERRATAQTRLHERGRALYRLSQTGLLPVAGGFGEVLVHLSRLDRLKRIVERDVQALASLRQRSRALGEETARIARGIEEQQAELDRLESRQEHLSQEHLTAQLMNQAIAYGDTVPAIPLDGPITGGIRVRNAEPFREGFHTLQGRLSPPVVGSARLRTASRRDGAGIEFIARQGEPVRSVGAGRVSFLRNYADYGLLAILDHGDGYYTLYGGLGQASVRAGDYVSEGSTIGTIGASPVPGALFFELRQGTQTLDARRWLGL